MAPLAIALEPGQPFGKFTDGIEAERYDHGPGSIEETTTAMRINIEKCIG